MFDIGHEYDLASYAFYFYVNSSTLNLIAENNIFTWVESKSYMIK